MRQLLKTGSDQSDSEDSQSDFSILQPLPLRSTDWEALEAICQHLDSTHSSYTAACNALQIGPSALWYATYQALAADKLPGESWSSALHAFRQRDARVSQLDRAHRRFMLAVAAIYFRKWRLTSSLENIGMAKCYAFEQNTLVTPVWNNWKTRALKVQNYTLLLDQAAKHTVLATKFRSWRQKSEAISTWSHNMHAQKLLFDVHRRLIETLAASETNKKRKLVITWRALALYRAACRTIQASAFALLRQKAQLMAQNKNIAIDMDRYNTMAPLLGRLRTHSCQINSCRAHASTATKTHWFKVWRSNTSMASKAALIASKHNHTQKQAAFTAWNHSTPLQSQALAMSAKNTATKYIKGWRLALKARLLYDSWQYHWVQLRVRLWYLKCSAEVHIQYHQLETKQRILGKWRTLEQQRTMINSSTLDGKYYPRWAASGLQNLRNQLELVQLYDRKALDYDHKRKLKSGVAILHQASATIDSWDAKATCIYAKNRFRQWHEAYTAKQHEMMESRAVELQLKHSKKLQKRCLKQWSGAVETHSVQLKSASGFARTHIVRTWRNRLAEHNHQLQLATEIESTNLKQLVFDAMVHVHDQLDEYHERSFVVDRIRTLQLQQTILRRMQMRLVRYKTQETEAARFADRKTHDSLKYLLRHWYARAVPRFEPVTPRSARRLPPSALRKIMTETRRPATSPGMETPTRVNRRLFRPSTS